MYQRLRTRPPVTAFRLRAVACLVSVACLASLAYAGADSKRQAEALLESLRSVPANAKLAKEPIRQATQSLTRAENARASQDDAHGQMLEDLALEWAETGRDLTRTAELETKIAQLQKETAEAEAKEVRALAIVEAAVARRGRAHEKLEAIGAIEAAPGSGEAEQPAGKGHAP